MLSRVVRNLLVRIMAHYLLTGAGFSRNWGCWLADEVFEYLLADPDITPQIRTQLWRDKKAGGTYEDTVAVLSPERTQHDLLLSILAGMFNKMKNAYATGSGFNFEWTSDARYQVHPFLQRFDAIFTLNQDTLLEHHYFDKFSSGRTADRWYDWDIPGVAPFHSFPKRSPIHPKKVGGALCLSGKGQPYIKLHGSHDWTTDPGYLLITGGNKETAIGSVPCWIGTLSTSDKVYALQVPGS